MGTEGGGSDKDHSMLYVAVGSMAFIVVAFALVLALR